MKPAGPCPSLHTTLHEAFQLTIPKRDDDASEARQSPSFDIGTLILLYIIKNDYYSLNVKIQVNSALLPVMPALGAPVDRQRSMASFGIDYASMRVGGDASSPSLGFKYLETSQAPRSFFNVPARTGLKRPVRPHHYAFILAGRLDQQYRSNPDIACCRQILIFALCSWPVCVPDTNLNRHFPINQGGKARGLATNALYREVQR